MGTPPKLFSTVQVAELLGCEQSRIRAIALGIRTKSHLLPNGLPGIGCKLGRDWFFTEVEVERIVEAFPRLDKVGKVTRRIERQRKRGG